MNSMKKIVCQKLVKISHYLLARLVAQKLIDTKYYYAKWTGPISIEITGKCELGQFLLRQSHMISELLYTCSYKIA